MPGVSSAFYRLLFAAAILWPVTVLRPGAASAARPKLPGGVLALAALGGVFFAGDVGLFNIAVLHTSAGAATLLGNNAPIFVGLLAWMVTRRAPPGQFWLALVVALAGGALIVLPDARRISFRSSADLLAVAASLCFALYLVVTERLRAHLDSVKLLALSSTASAATLGLAAVLTRTSLAIPNGQAWAAVLALAIVCQVVGYFALTYALGHLPATVTSVGFLGVGPLTALLALMLFGERMTAVQVAGGALVLAGIWLAGKIEKVPAFE